MFNKDMEKLKSFLGTQSELQGELKIRGVLRLDCAVTGKIQADQVILSKTAVVKGTIEAKKIIVDGIVEGTLRAADVLEIGSNGNIKGEIFTNKLLVMEGGRLNGQIEMKTDKANVFDFEKNSDNERHNLSIAK